MTIPLIQSLRPRVGVNSQRLTTMLAGALQQVSRGDYRLATMDNFMVVVEGNTDVNVTAILLEKVGKLCGSVAAVRQEMIAPVVWVGSKSLNVLQLMSETLNVVKQLAELMANHTHSNTVGPVNSSKIHQSGASTDVLKLKFRAMLG